MKTTNKKILITSLLGVASLATIGSTLAFNGQTQNKAQLDDDTRTAIHEAVLNGDYTEFQAITTSLENHPEMTEERFEGLSQRVINNENSRGENNKDRMENREDRMEDMKEKRVEMMEIMNNADYDSWKEIAQDDMLEVIDTEDKFEQLVEMHEHLESANEIREELGLPERRIQKPNNRR